MPLYTRNDPMHVCSTRQKQCNSTADIIRVFSNTYRMLKPWKSFKLIQESTFTRIKIQCRIPWSASLSDMVLTLHQSFLSIPQITRPVGFFYLQRLIYYETCPQSRIVIATHISLPHLISQRHYFYMHKTFSWLFPCRGTSWTHLTQCQHFL